MVSVKRTERVVAIVAAAGMGKRFGSDANKPFFPLNGKPLILWSLETLASVAEITEIIPVLKVEDMTQGMMVFDTFGISKIRQITPGGKERQDSVYNGLKRITDKNCIVLIHDGARPLIDKTLVEEVIKEVSEIMRNREKCDGVIPGIPLKDTVKESAGGVVKKTLKRETLWAIQTPQGFPYRKIRAAYDNAMKDSFYTTDDAALIERYGRTVKIIPGSYKNIKITTPEDIVIAEALLKMNA